MTASIGDTFTGIGGSVTGIGDSVTGVGDSDADIGDNGAVKDEEGVAEVLMVNLVCAATRLRAGEVRCLRPTAEHRQPSRGRADRD